MQEKKKSTPLRWRGFKINAYKNMKQYKYKYKLAVQINQYAYMYASFLGPVISK